VLLHVLAHVDADHRRSSSNRNSASALASSVLPTPVGPRNRNEPIGRFGSCRPARARRTARATRHDRLVLADDALAQALLQLAHDLHLEARRGLVDQVDGLVGQEAVGDVAVRERGGRDERRVLDADAVVDLVALLEAAQDRDRVLDVGSPDEHRLEAALERGVLLDVLAVLVERGRADAAQLAARERRLEHVGRRPSRPRPCRRRRACAARR
jgi:hypothetical protein